MKVELVGGLVAIYFIFPYIGLLIIPIDELIFFRGVAQPPTREKRVKKHDVFLWIEAEYDAHDDRRTRLGRRVSVRCQ